MPILLLAAAVAAPVTVSQPSKEFIQACYARATSQAEKDFCAGGEEAVRSQLPPDQETNRCFDQAITQPAMTACADASFKRADARLNAQWAKTAAAFKRVDEDNKQAGQETGAFDSLLQGQRAWLTYRKATCHAQGLVKAGGTIRDMNELACLDTITTARTKELYELSLNPNSDEPL